jgi:hypothetical protein
VQRILYSQSSFAALCLCDNMAYLHLKGIVMRVPGTTRRLGILVVPADSRYVRLTRRQRRCFQGSRCQVIHLPSDYASLCGIIIHQVHHPARLPNFQTSKPFASSSASLHFSGSPPRSTRRIFPTSRSSISPWKVSSTSTPVRLWFELLLIADADFADRSAP